MPEPDHPEKIGSERIIYVANSPGADKSEPTFEVATVWATLRAVRIHEPPNVDRESMQFAAGRFIRHGQVPRGLNQAAFA